MFATLGLLGLACERREQLPANQETFRAVVERRGAYAKISPDTHANFPRFFAGGLVEGISMRTVSVGEVDMTKGDLVVADPFHFTADFTHPFTRRVPSGRYPLEIAVGSFGESHERVAFARVRLSDLPAVRWEIAKTTGTTPLNESFGVDAGLAAFAGSSAAERLAVAMRTFDKEHPNGNYYDDVMAHDIPGEANWGVHHLADGTNVPIVSSGLGDGLYSSYWGLDASGNVAQLVTDFQLFDLQGPVMRK